MPRSRNIKPGFFGSEKLAECSFQARLLFIGLWTLCDFRGVMEYRPKRIKALIFPYENANIEELLKELSDHGLIATYVVDIAAVNSFSSPSAHLQPSCSPALAVLQFKKHQHPHHEEVKKGSNLPDLPLLVKFGTPFTPGSSSSSLPEAKLQTPPIRLIPDTLIPDTLPVSTKQGRSPKVRPKTKSPASPTKGPKKKSSPKPQSAEDILASLPAGFKRLWEIAPEQARVDQVGAAMAYHKLVRTKQDPKGRGPRGVELGQIIDGLKLWVRSEEWAKDEGKFVPSLKKFFHDEQWKRKPRGFQQPAANPGVDEHPVDPDNQEGMAF